MADAIPDHARVYAKTLADLYGEAVVSLLRVIADRANRGLDDTSQRAKLADLLALRTEARGVAALVSDLLDDTLADVLGSAYDLGTTQATANLVALTGTADAATDRAVARTLVATKRSTVEALAGRLAGTLRDLPIIPATEAAYRAAITNAVVPQAAGVETQRQALQRALDQLALRGIGNVVDSSGRRWQLDTYADMATRSTVMQAAVQGTVDRVRATTPFGRISDSPDECEICRPWEGQVVLLVPPSQVPEKWQHVPFKGTLRDATSAGVFHPNCTHGIGAFIPGLTRGPDQRPPRENPQGYADRQRLRQLERHVREWKRREAVAITPQAQTQAARKVQEWQQQISVHTGATQQPRRRDREQLRLPRP